jgi:hypothetical protein
VSKLGTSKKPLILRVRTLERAAEIGARCDQLNAMYVIGVEKNEPEDLTDLDRYLRRKPRPKSPWRLR